MIRNDGELYSEAHNRLVGLRRLVTKSERSRSAGSSQRGSELAQRRRLERTVSWYSLVDKNSDLKELDLLGIDGPQGGDIADARLPALEVFRDSLSFRAVVFLDDGRREHETTIAKRWIDAFPMYTASQGLTTTGYWLLTRDT